MSNQVSNALPEAVKRLTAKDIEMMVLALRFMKSLPQVDFNMMQVFVGNGASVIGLRNAWYDTMRRIRPNLHEFVTIPDKHPSKRVIETIGSALEGSPLKRFKQQSPNDEVFFKALAIDRKLAEREKKAAAQAKTEQLEVDKNVNAAKANVQELKSDKAMGPAAAKAVAAAKKAQGQYAKNIRVFVEKGPIEFNEQGVAGEKRRREANDKVAATSAKPLEKTPEQAMLDAKIKEAFSVEHLKKVINPYWEGYFVNMKPEIQPYLQAQNTTYGSIASNMPYVSPYPPVAQAPTASNIPYVSPYPPVAQAPTAAAAPEEQLGTPESSDNYSGTTASDTETNPTDQEKSGNSSEAETEILGSDHEDDVNSGDPESDGESLDVSDLEYEFTYTAEGGVEWIHRG